MVAIGRVLRGVLVKFRGFAPLLLLLGALLLQACGFSLDDSEEHAGSSESVGSVAQQVVGPSSFSISIPGGMVPQSVAVWSSQALRLADRVNVRKGANGFGRVVNIGTGSTEVGADGKTGDIWAGSGLALRSRARVEGDAIVAGGVTKQTDVVVTGLLRTNTAITPLQVSSWQVTLPAQTLGSASLEPDRSRAIPPGGYTSAYIKSRSTLSLSHGVYVFDSLTIDPQAKLSINDAAGPVMVYVNSAFTFRGTVVDAGTKPDDKVELLVVARGSNQSSVEAPFKGTVFVPNGSLYVGPLNGGPHFGAFFGKSVYVEAGVIINQRSFPWADLLPPTVVNWKDAPVVLNPAVGSSGEGQGTGVAEVTPPAPVSFTIPDSFWVSNGNAGNGKTELTFRTQTGATVICQYKGGSPTAHPLTALDQAKGRRYKFVSCNNGLVAGAGATGSWFKLAVVGSDSNFPETSIEAHLGGGCSGSLPPPMFPEEVVALREHFNWLTTGALSEVDPAGRAALWHGLIYVERKEQLEALDRWRVKWSTAPFSRKYLEKYRGKCGRVEHASDMQGVFVYAIFPAKLFNLIRTFSIEAKLKNNPAYPPPFAVMLPSTPDDPEYVNTDGTLKYETLASAGYADWLATSTAQQPWFLEDWVDSVSETAADIGLWVDDNIIDPAVDIVEDGIAFVGSLWDTFVDWVAIAVDDVWESIQEGLGDIFVNLGTPVKVTIELGMLNRDPNLPGGRMLRLWGRNVAAGDNTGSGGSRVGQRPFLAPHGVQVRIRQWGWGFIPLLHEATLPGGGAAVTIEAAQGEEGRGDSQLCFELDSDAGSITSDLIPDEVCGFDGASFSDFDTDTKSFIQTDQADLHAMTQIVDSNDYVRTVIGREPRHVDVLTGFLANQITSFLNGLPFDIFQDKERAMALCLDFPSLSQTSITALLTKLAGQFGLAASPLIMKDIWWPTKGDSPNSRVMTHEYGHFLMCDMFYAEKGPAGLTPLMGRVVEGQNDSPDDDLAITTEAWADLFSMQVTGASNYIRGQGATGLKMKYCQSGGSCMDYNYRGVGFYPDDPSERASLLADKGKDKLGFSEELARTESILQDLFDRGDSTFRETDNPWNGDVLDRAGVYSTSSYLGHADENVSLGGSAWKKWAENWAELGPDVSRTGIIHSLHRVAKQSHNWCQRCELFALHDKDGMNVQGPADLDAMATAQDRWDRWEQCLNNQIDYFGETPPEPHLNLSPSCTPCGPGEFTDTNNAGACTSCATGEIPRGDHCEKCLPGLVPGPNNECVACGMGQISVGNVCEACAFGQGANRATNTCVDCTPDAWLDWNTVGDPGCQAILTEVKATPTPAANDICPDYTWVELRNLDTLVAQQRDTLNVEVVPEDLFSGPFSGSGTPLSGIIQKLLCPTYSLALLGYTPRSGDPNVAWGMDHGQSDAKGQWGSCVGEPWCENLDDESCLWNARVEYTAPEITAAGNRVRFLAVAAQGSSLAPLRLLLTASQPNTLECDPK